MKVLLLVAQLLIITTIAQAQPYQVVSTENSTVTDDLHKTITTIQEGNNSLNRFRMTKVSKALPLNALKGVIFLLPPLGSGFQNYEVGDNGDYSNSLAGFFAVRNYVVFGYSFRQHGLVAGSCESGAIDCSPMVDWGLQTIADDAAYIRSQIALEYPGLDIFVGGLSAGSIGAMAVINANPGDYDGAILIEGTIYDEDANVRAINTNFCTAFDGMLAGGVYYDGTSGPFVKFVSQQAQSAPNAPAMFPGFPPGLTNHQAFVLALSAPPLSPLAPRPGYFNVAGDVAEDRFFFSNESLIHGSLAGFNDYTPIRSMRDLNCGLAGDTTFTGNLGAFDGPVIMFVAGHGFGSAMLDTAELMSSADVTIKSRGDYGHVDYTFATNHLQQLEHQILKWLP